MKKTIALLGQPNSGKSTLFNGLTGSHQHVGNWPGKTVEKMEGSFTYENEEYTLVDLPGTYSLSANSDEEIITRDYIADGNADLVCILADASQLERSLFMLTDFIGLQVPAVLILNLMDVATKLGKEINPAAMEEQLGIPVIPFVAADKSQYTTLLKTLKKALAAKKLLHTDYYKRYFSSETQLPYFAVKELVSDCATSFRSPHWLAVKCMENDKNVLTFCKAGLSKEKYAALTALTRDIKRGSLYTGNCKFAIIHDLTKAAVNSPTKKPVLSKFDRIATSRIWGKPLAIGVMLLSFAVAMIFAMPLMGVGMAIPSLISEPLYNIMTSLKLPPMLISLISQLVPNIISFAFSMCGFVMAVTFIFSAMEEIGYMARMAFVFDSLMAKLGLQGKSICAFLMGFGCTIGGAAGTRVIDNWGQRLLAIALVWSVPCAATWAVMPTLAQIFFGNGAVIVLISLLLFMFVMMAITAKVFGNTLAPKENRVGMIMELPPYHKPKWGHIIRTTLSKGVDIFWRAIKVITVVSVVFWLLSYTSTGNVENSIIYNIGIFIEPFTKLFGLSWQTFMAFVASAISKEAVLGVLSALYTGSGDVFTATFGTVGTADLNVILPQVISKAEALAFIFACTFNMPCLVALASTHRESHSLKWTVRIALYYTGMALLLSFVVYHIGLVVF
ncbi:MAG: ferrous iron transport protein B [Lachnospiraceae bacterium]|nr:ferrous iron transport protein B [Lachnospiraceae bacterium]